MRVHPGVSQNIQGTQTEGAKKTERSKELERAREAAEAARTHGVMSHPGAEISSRAKDFAKAHAIASATPDVREDRIAELKRRIASGEYQVDSDKVAEKMIGEHSL
jgi:negative regulator of flagellin synthesis FlgM